MFDWGPMETIAKHEDRDLFILKEEDGEVDVKARLFDQVRLMLGPIQWLGSILAHVDGPWKETDQPAADELITDAVERDDRDLTIREGVEG